MGSGTSLKTVAIPPAEASSPAWFKFKASLPANASTLAVLHIPPLHTPYPKNDWSPSPSRRLQRVRDE